MLEEVIVDGREWEASIINHQQPTTTDNNQQLPTTTSNNNNHQQWLNLVDGCEGQAGAERGKWSEGEGSKQAAALSRAPFASDPFSVIFIYLLEKLFF